jgi:hypothetical protein
MGGAVGERTEAVEMRDCGTLVEMKYGIGGCARHRLMEFGDGRKVGGVRRLPKLRGGAATTGPFITRVQTFVVRFGLRDGVHYSANGPDDIEENNTSPACSLFEEYVPCIKELKVCR